jgi:hypothetical protein
MPRILFALLVLAAAVTARADQVLVDPGQLDLAALSALDAKLSLPRGALRVTTGHAQRWPGVTIPAPGGRWDLEGLARIEVELRNPGKGGGVRISCRVDNPGADGNKNCITAHIDLAPGQTATLSIALPRMQTELARRLYGMRGLPAGLSAEARIDPGNINQILLFITQPKQEHTFEVLSIRAAGEQANIDQKTFFPFIDSFGQYIHADWPGKTRSIEHMRKQREEEVADMAKNPGPEEWNQYGGWKAGPALRATGFFRTEKHAGKWWLVDPEGRLFFSHGIDCVGGNLYTPISERDDWFADRLWDRSEFDPFVLARGRSIKFHYADKNPRCFDFGMANKLRKYGEDWKPISADLAHQRLRSWGMNTIANWSDTSIALQRRTPYVATISSGGRPIEGSSGYWRKFPDPFDPSFCGPLRQRLAKEKGRMAGDPWCIGFFVDNEESWGDDMSLAVAALQSPPQQAAKVAFIEHLRQKYGQVQKLNEAWGTSHASWDALRDSREAPDRKRAGEDLRAFYLKIAEQYFRVIRDSIREVSPGQLYLGCRFAWTNPLAAEAATKYCDVVSYNLYRRSVAGYRPPFEADVPLIIGEFHFGALDRGMFHTGLVPVNSQEERAAAYRSYVEGALRHPSFVGTHWFQYSDQATTGRVLDAENYQIGFVSITDHPHPETVEASRQIGRTMYRLRLGQ